MILNAFSLSMKEVIGVLVIMVVLWFVWRGRRQEQEKGVVLCFQDGGKFRDMNHLFHFMEHVIMGMSQLYSQGYTRFDVKCLAFPLLHESNDWIGKWSSHNKTLISRVFPNIESIRFGDPYGNYDHTSRPRKPYGLNYDKVIVSDRHAWCRAPYNKMIMKGILPFPTHAWSLIFHPPKRNNTSNPKIVVAYIDRQKTGRRLRQEDHEFLISFCESCPHFDFHVYKMEEYDFSTQMALAAKVDILIGVHGNGLTHCMFMKPKSFVIECFVETQKRYLFDYNFLAKTMTQTYFCMIHGQWVCPLLFEKEALERRTMKYSLDSFIYQPLMVEFPKVIDHILLFFPNVNNECSS
jgi:hypothetical protein